MDGQQSAVAEDTDELDVLYTRGVAVPGPPDFAILATGGTVREPSREIRNVSVDPHRHAFIIHPLGEFTAGQSSSRSPIRLSGNPGRELILNQAIIKRAARLL
jgi:hypothetical protein